MRDMDLVACHLIGDYVLQTNEMAANKLTDARVRAHHVARYSVPFAVAGALSGASWGRLAAFLALNAAAHYAADSKRWLPNDEWPPGTILNDQAVHAVTLALLSRLLEDS